MQESVIKRDIRFKIGLTFIPGIGSILAKNLLSYCGSAEGVFKASKSRLLKIPGIGPVVADAITNQSVLKRADKEVEFIDQYKIQPLFFSEADFPVRLRNCIDCPIILYYKGNADLNAPRVISIVGTRKPTVYGKAFCKSLIEELRSMQVLIISGLAYGIDVTVHREAIKSGLPTVGVLGHGLQTLYPSQHLSTAKQMLEHGGLLTEFNSQDLMVKHNFPQRNRVVAGMSDAVIVVESSTKGGSIITANIANSYNRDVFALPGRFNDPLSAGCNHLIKTHKAAVIESANDLIEAMGWDEKPVQTRVQRQLLLELNETEQQLINLIRECDGIEMEEVIKTSKIPPSRIASSLLELEMKGFICSLPGKKFKLV